LILITLSALTLTELITESIFYASQNAALQFILATHTHTHIIKMS